MATGSGQYHFKDPVILLEDGNVSNDKEENSTANTTVSDGYILQNEVDLRYSDESENNLVFWWIGDMVDMT